MVTQDELYNFICENTRAVVARNWYIDLERASRSEALLYGFTPGGSEYVNDPHRCALHIKERLSGVVEQVKRRKKAEIENKELREINDDLSAKLDSMIIVNCQALACSAPVAAEVERLRTELNASSALAIIRAQAIEIERLQNMFNVVTHLWHQAIDADILDDAHELEAAIVKASTLLNYPPAEE
jgi:hypothetical protein